MPKIRLARLAAAVAISIAMARPAAAVAFDLTEIAPGVYVHPGVTAMMTNENLGGIANLGAVVGETAVAIIDPGGSALEGEAFRDALAAKTSKPVKYVIYTHAHPDHVFGAAAFAGSGVSFVGHRNLSRALATRGEHYLESFRPAMGEALAGVRIIPPDQTVEDVLTLDLGGRRLRLTAWRTAHSDCDLTVFDESGGTLFAGDLLFIGHVPVVDGSLLGFLDVVARLAEIPARQVVPGHGPAVAPWPQALDDQRTYLLRLTADLRAAIRKGETLDAASRTAGAAERPKWRLFDDYHPRNATAGFAELEWETP
jgi:quinoprotein relay system zinc metallohydrolase 2